MKVLSLPPGHTHAASSLWHPETLFSLSPSSPPDISQRLCRPYRGSRSPTCVFLLSPPHTPSAPRAGPPKPTQQMLFQPARGLLPTSTSGELSSERPRQRKMNRASFSKQLQTPQGPPARPRAGSLPTSAASWLSPRVSLPIASPGCTSIPLIPGCWVMLRGSTTAGASLCFTPIIFSVLNVMAIHCRIALELNAWIFS